MLLLLSRSHGRKEEWIRSRLIVVSELSKTNRELSDAAMHLASADDGAKFIKTALERGRGPRTRVGALRIIPISGILVAGHHEDLGSELDGTTLALNRVGVAIKELQQLSVGEGVAIHLIDNNDLLSIVLVPPWALRLPVGVGEAIANSAGLASPGGTEIEIALHGPIAARSLKALVAAQAALVLDELSEVVLSNALHGSTRVDSLLDGEQVRASALALLLTMLPGTLKLGGLLAAVGDALSLVAETAIKVGALKLVTVAKKRSKRHGLGKLQVALEVLAVRGGTQLALVDHEGDVVRQGRVVEETKLLVGGGEEREHVTTCLTHS
ncbi:MAG: hypothetical protein [Cressdnaviricota sp.]|nr:MAG: hypothetical protein [Cressdnaviricota sp.]